MNLAIVDARVHILLRNVHIERARQYLLDLLNVLIRFCQVYHWPSDVPAGSRRVQRVTDSPADINSRVVFFL